MGSSIEVPQNTNVNVAGIDVGLTATPAKHTYGFFNQNVVMEYPHAQAVADGVNCDYEVYRIRTRITGEGSTVEAVPGTMLGYRDRQTRKTRWEAPDEDVSYEVSDLDKNVVAIDQIRLIVQTFRDKVLKETFPERTEVPKTLIFAKDDSHAEDIVRIVREEFGTCASPTSKMRAGTEMACHAARGRAWPFLTALRQQAPSVASLRCHFGVTKFVTTLRRKRAFEGDSWRQRANRARAEKRCSS